VRRILIFDNHPDSLRLTSGYHRADPHGDLFGLPPRTNSRGLILVGMLVVVLLIALVWPLF
jgi:hypothetical protein